MKLHEITIFHMLYPMYTDTTRNDRNPPKDPPGWGFANQQWAGPLSSTPPSFWPVLDAKPVICRVEAPFLQGYLGFSWGYHEKSME